MQWIHAVLLLKHIDIVAPWIVTRADNDKPTTQMQNEKTKSHPNPNLAVSLFKLLSDIFCRQNSDG